MRWMALFIHGQYGEEGGRMSDYCLKCSITRIVAHTVRSIRRRETSAWKGGAMRCARCANVIPINIPFCAYCGTPQPHVGHGSKG